jgi:membrane-associated phospholipid phosphatase
VRVLLDRPDAPEAPPPGLRRAIAPGLLVLAIVAALPTHAAENENFPYELKTGREIALFGVGAGLIGGAVLVAQGQDTLTVAEIADLDVDDVNSFDRGATERWSPGASQAADWLVGAMLLSPTLLAVTGPGNDEPATVLAMYGETLLLNIGVVELLKGLVGRTRPYVYNDDPEISLEEKTAKTAVRSFPSGHTANAFAAAVFLGGVHARLNPGESSRTWVWVGSLTAATTVGILRVTAGKHFPTDVIAGAAVGALIGWAVPRLHERDTAGIPSAGKTGNGWNLAWRVDF